MGTHVSKHPIWLPSVHDKTCGAEIGDWLTTSGLDTNQILADQIATYDNETHELTLVEFVVDDNGARSWNDDDIGFVKATVTRKVAPIDADQCTRWSTRADR